MLLSAFPPTLFLLLSSLLSNIVLRTQSHSSFCSSNLFFPSLSPFSVCNFRGKSRFLQRTRFVRLRHSLFTQHLGPLHETPGGFIHSGVGAPCSPFVVSCQTTLTSSLRPGTCPATAPCHCHQITTVLPIPQFN